MLADPFRSPRQRFARAQEKIAELKAAIEAFVKGKPYARVVEKDASSGAELHKIKMTTALPDQFTDLTMEIIEALRSALDQAGFACAVLTGKPDAKSALFPFADDESSLANAIKGRCKDLPADIVTLFRSFQPYKGGNDALWAMNKIRHSTHTVLVPIGNAVGGMTIRGGRIQAPKGGSASILMPRWDGAKNEMIFGQVDAGGQFHYNVEFTFFIAFGDAPVVGGKEVLAVLNHFASVVAGILAATEAECRRIGLIK